MPLTTKQRTTIALNIERAQRLQAHMQQVLRVGNCTHEFIVQLDEHTNECHCCGKLFDILPGYD